jgi:hypothetical protein
VKAKKIEIPIVCHYGELDAIKLGVTLGEQVLISAFNSMRKRLLKQGEGLFFSDVTLGPGTEVCATINLYVQENQHFEVFAIFRDELEKLTGDRYSIDCSALHRPVTPRKPLPTRKSK